MKKQIDSKGICNLETSSPLYVELEWIGTKCINCELCQKECAFLRTYGTPKEIADACTSNGTFFQTMAFECSLCGLCEAVCPVHIDPLNMFLKMRQAAVQQGKGNFKAHQKILDYEKRGTSRRYSWYGLPEGCDTVFFPGCTLTGTRPDKTLAVFERIQKQIPSVGIVLDCCTKPSHDLGRESYFKAMFKEIKEFLAQNNVKKILTACPNCTSVFEKYGEDLSVTTIYEYLAEHCPPKWHFPEKSVTVHDPCVIRFSKPVHTAVRKLISELDIQVREMPHTADKTLCCGEGGSTEAITPGLAEKWSAIRKQEHGKDRIVTCCAGCVGKLSRTMPVTHILDLYFEPKKALAGRSRVHKAPFTYWNRLKLKKYLKKHLRVAVSRERTFQADCAQQRIWDFKRIPRSAGPVA